MVFMTMGNEKRLDFMAVGLQVRIIGNDITDPREIGFGETDPGIDHDQGIERFKAIGVLTDFAKASEGIDINGRMNVHNNEEDVSRNYGLVG